MKSFYKDAFRSGDNGDWLLSEFRLRKAWSENKEVAYKPMTKPIWRYWMKKCIYEENQVPPQTKRKKYKLEHCDEKRELLKKLRQTILH